MKVFSTIFSFITLCVILPIIHFNIKQNIGHTWLREPYTLGKLICPNIFLSVKQNLSYAWLLGPHALGKLILIDIFLSVKQNLSYVGLLEPHTLGKLILPIIFLSVKQNLSYVGLLGQHTLGKLILPIIFLSVKQNLSHAWLFRPCATFYYSFKYQIEPVVLIGRTFMIVTWANGHSSVSLKAFVSISSISIKLFENWLSPQSFRSTNM